MVDSQEVEEGGVEIADVDDVLHRVVAEFVGLTIAEAGFDAASGHPHGESFDVVVTTGSAFPLKHGRAAKFAAPDDEGVFEKAALFEVGEERPGRFVGVACADFHVFIEAAVVVPSAVVELDKAGAFFNEATGEKAVGGIRAIAGSRAIHLQGFLGFAGEIGEFGDGGLHTKGHFIGADPGGNLGIVDKFVTL